MRLRPGAPWFRLAPYGGGGGDSDATLSTSDFYYDDTVAGTIDGANASFTLDFTPSPAFSLFLRLGRQEQIQGVDYTLAVATITYTTAPDASLSGEPHRASYRTA